jgi:hypothetical protein
MNINELIITLGTNSEIKHENEKRFAHNIY